MSSNFILLFFRFVFLLFLQLFLFNKINLFGYLNPMPYILFIILFPISKDRMSFLLVSFLYGLVLDVFLNTGGIHTTACLVLAFFRPKLLQITYGQSYEYQANRLFDRASSERMTYFVLAILTHHFTLYLLENFRLSMVFSILFQTILNTIFTFIICVLAIYLIKKKK